MRKFLVFCLVLFCLPGIIFSSPDKPRVIVLTDIENEPDDTQSLVRFLLYSNHYDVEGLIATTSIWMHRNRKEIAEQSIKKVVRAYGKVRNNLILHEPGFPSEQYLLSVIKRGSPAYGMQGVGKGKDSEGSDWLINVVDRDDTRPVWVTVWGGPNVLAQALWKVSRIRTPAELKRFVSKLRVYTISDQDDSGPWIRKEFPGVFYIVSPGSHYRHATWPGISGEPWYKFASGADTAIISNSWLRKNIIENHGPLGSEYPLIAYIMEGDTPSFLSLIDNGLNVPERPDYGGWGGRYELYQPRFLPYRNSEDAMPETRPIWTDVQDEVVGKDGSIYISNHATIWRWRDAYQSDFAARLDWCTQTYSQANHPPVVYIAGPIDIQVTTGEQVILDASASSDPDGDELRFRWIHYPEPGDFWHWQGLILQNTETPVLALKVPDYITLQRPQTTHIILEVTDTGNPGLTRYQRIIVSIMPGRN